MHTDTHAHSHTNTHTQRDAKMCPHLIQHVTKLIILPSGHPSTVLTANSPSSRQRRRAASAPYETQRCCCFLQQIVSLSSSSSSPTTATSPTFSSSSPLLLVPSVNISSAFLSLPLTLQHLILASPSVFLFFSSFMRPPLSAPFASLSAPLPLPHSPRSWSPANAHTRSCMHAAPQT